MLQQKELRFDERQKEIAGARQAYLSTLSPQERAAYLTISSSSSSSASSSHEITSCFTKTEEPIVPSFTCPAKWKPRSDGTLPGWILVGPAKSGTTAIFDDLTTGHPRK